MLDNVKWGLVAFLDLFFSRVDQSLSLIDLTLNLCDKFEQQGVVSDLEEAIQLGRTALALCPPGHSYRALSLHNLATVLRFRVIHQDVLSDLEEAVELHRAALALCPPDHSNRSLYLNSLGLSLQGVQSDLDEAIELHQAALVLCPPGHSQRPLSLNNLAMCLCTRFQQQCLLPDLEDAIKLHQAALVLCPPGHSARFEALSNLGKSLRDRFEHCGILSDLQEAITLHEAALALCPPSGNSNHRSSSLNSLASCLDTRFKQQGALSDLEAAIDLHRAALALRPPGHINHSSSLNNLACSLRARFQWQGVPSDLEEAIGLNQAALASCPPDHISQSVYLNNLATSLQERFQQQGLLSDLEEAIELHRTALSLHPPGHLYRSVTLNNLAKSLQVRFEQQSVLSDLEEALELHRAALALRPPGHPDRSTCLSSLAGSLVVRFEQRSILSDLDEAIELYRAALALHPPGHFGRSRSLNNLVTTLNVGFTQHVTLSDLSEAIELGRPALVLCPPGHSNQSMVFNNLSEAIELGQAALVLCPPGHSDRSMALNNLASCFYARFVVWSILSDLDEAIELYRTALTLYPPGHSHLSVPLNNLARTLHARFIQQHTLSDLNEAIELYQTALALHPPGHSGRSRALNNLAMSLKDRFVQQGLSSDLNEIFSLYAQHSQVSHALSSRDLYVARSWAASAEQLQHGSALAAYQTALKFLDDWQHLIGFSSSSRHFDIVRQATSSLAIDAFSCAVRHSALTTAVELVEQGRAVFWTQLARFRTPLDDISASGPTGEALVEEFKQLSFQLRSALDTSPEYHSQQIHQLTMQWDDVVSSIRMLPDFSRFLLPPLFSDLQKAADYGPVIIVNASQYSCDALIILNSARGPVHIPLDIVQFEVSELSTEFQSLVDHAGSSNHHLESQNIVGVLRKLWDRIVGPIVDSLQELIRPGSRIWWCPTAEFTLLPLHAAGPYEKKSHNLSHFYISSYTPTLAALIRARQQISRDASTPHFIAIGQGNPDIGRELPHIAAELDGVAQHIAPVLSFTSLVDSDATVQGALDALSRHQWLHLASHGMPNREKPFDSSFAMRDGPLTITDIIRSRMRNPEFAFLSACHTTVGHASSPDEAIHLAAAMQFSGFRSVIGSMWSVDDEAAGRIVSAFYKNLVDDSGRLDCTRAAEALHQAMKKLRKKKIPLEQQIVFVHIGV
ncbi:hypothetical protein AZE42_01624 [Rhizopogon vesiculosus]|uniref:CHAT domain-containing protein n=1 Tax=Rhizopogon vesiculosus TaxID=180088 RepID=A0A1J8R4E0_9AGAM|nr:hypothetical protein AZE42_01624 [Rhizopogon vesiculosus]